ncbi:hypothetical protein MPSEU_000442200 [Mayamaea pseudoterrestris]|nr:hypothetical protein MPSEU_000442200 [Mayamaea pseudoterrestris]
MIQQQAAGRRCHFAFLLMSWLLANPSSAFSPICSSLSSQRMHSRYMVGDVGTDIIDSSDQPARTNGADDSPSLSLLSIDMNNDPTLSPNYHRKRRMAVAATGLVGQAAQIYSRYLSRLWKETNIEARTQSSQKKIATSIRQLNQLLTNQEKKLNLSSTTAADAAKDAILIARKVQGACQDYLDYESLTQLQADVLVPLTAPAPASIPLPVKAKTRRSIGFGALMGLAVAGMVFSGNYVFTGIFTLMAVLGQLEYYRMVMNTGVLPARRISILGSASMFITALVAPSLHEVCLPLFGLYTMIWFLTMRRTVSTIPEIATTFSGMFYLGYVPSFWVRIRQTGSQLPLQPSLAPWAAPYVTAMTSKIQSFIPAFVLPAIHLPITSGAIFIFWTWLCIAFSDVGAYFAGVSFGKTKLGQISPAAGEASPNKTVEGVLGGCFVSGMLGILGAWAQRWPHFVVTGAAHGVMLALCGLIGDLTASMLKRDAGLKDFGDLLPEHGGIMDRVDSYIWTAPYSWWVISFALPALRRYVAIGERKNDKDVLPTTTLTREEDNRYNKPMVFCFGGGSQENGTPADGTYGSATSFQQQQPEPSAPELPLQLPTCSSRCYDFSIACSPDLAPMPWACINFVCLLWSTLLIFAIYQTEGPLERVFGTQLYLSWNLVTTIIWCFEIGLIVTYRKTKSTYINWLELVAAVYFFQDSITLMQLVFSMEPDDDIQGEVLDAVINAFAYLYQFVDSLYLYSQRARRERNEPVEYLSDALMRTHQNNNAEDFY